MPGRRRWSILAAALAGCAAAHPVTQRAAVTVVVVDRSAVPLDAISPAPCLPPPTTRPHGRPPVDALVAYAAGRDAAARGDPAAAAIAFGRAAAADPDRFAVQAALARALRDAHDPAGDAALARAVDLDPTDVAAQTDLGRADLTAGRTDAAVRRLRLAAATPGYAADAGAAAVVDLLLARSLAAAGFDRAALDRYLLLIRRFDDAALPVRDHPELIELTDRPALLLEPIAELYDRHGQWAAALRTHQAAAAQEPGRADLDRAIALDRAHLGHDGDAANADLALRQATDAVVRTAAAPPSLALLADVCAALGRSDVAVLRRLWADHPADHAILFAVMDRLSAAGDPAAATAQLAAAWHRSPGDVRLARRLVDALRHRGDTAAAAAVVLDASAADPDAAATLGRSWDALSRPGQPNRLRTMPTTGHATSVADFWHARLDATLGHTAASAAALDRAAHARPPFPPAVRAWVDLTWARPTAVDKAAACEQLAATLDPPLAAEVRGRSLLAAHRPLEAAASLAESVRLGNRSPAAALALANAYHAAGSLQPQYRDPAYAAAVSRVLLQHPQDESAAVALFGYQVDPVVGDLAGGLRTLAAWRAGEPDAVPARVLQARTDHQLDPGPAVDRAADDLLAADGDDPDVLTAVVAVYRDRPAVLIAKLDAYRRSHPRDTDAAAALAGVQARAGRTADALATIDAARSAAADDADALYTVATLYARLDRRPVADAVLEQALRVDPAHPGASNDLGFELADAGRDLPRAEGLIRTAVAAEPDNPAFLDSLGWVLYKRGRFADARPVLERACGPSADPAVLDHLGDTLYRLDRVSEAAAVWQRALSALSAGDDQPALRQQLRQKVTQAAARRSVDVAPLAWSGG